MAGTDLAAATDSTHWIELLEPSPTGTGGVALATKAICIGTPPTTANMFAHGCLMTQLDTANGNPSLFQNTGTAASPSFSLIGNIGGGTVLLANLASGVRPTSINKFDAQYTTGGGAAAEAITVTGALNTDRAFVQLVNDGPNNVSVLSAVVTANTLTVTFSADPGAGTVINYLITRTAS